MKRILKNSLAVVLVLSLVFSFAGCNIIDRFILGNTVDKAGKWEDAIYRKDTELGEGNKTVTVQVIVEENTVSFTLHTDCDILGDALSEQGLVEGEMGAYGLYVKRVNGILADYDVDGTYWSLYKNGEYSMTGVDTTPIADGEHYELVCEG